jgi:hypothetical protein
MNTRSPLGRKELIDEYFIENRTRLLEIAAFLDRLDRASSGPPHDFRMQAFSEALAAVAAGTGDRLSHVQMLLSDPTTEPLDALDRKSALGAYDRPSGSGQGGRP